MKTIKKFFKLMNGREMYPYEEDNIESLLNEFLYVMIVVIFICMFYLSLHKILF